MISRNEGSIHEVSISAPVSVCDTFNSFCVHLLEGFFRSQCTDISIFSMCIVQVGGKQIIQSLVYYWCWLCRSSGPCTYATIRSDKYSAILGDFGVVTVALPYSLALGTVALAGTLGYLPPEFTDGKHGLRSDMNIQLWSGKFLLCALNKSHTGITLI